MFKVCELWSCDMNSTLGSVVPLAMLFLENIDGWFFICTFCPRKQIGGRAPLEGLLPRNDPQKFLRAQGGGTCPATGGHRGILRACPISSYASVIPKFFWCFFWTIWLSTTWLNLLYLVYFLNIRVAWYLQWRALACNQVIKEGTPMGNWVPSDCSIRKVGSTLTDRDHHKKKRQSYGNDAATSNNFMTFGLLGARQ